MDPRLKVAGVAIISLSMTLTGWKILTLNTFAILGLIYLSHTTLRIYRSLLTVTIWMGLFYGVAVGWVWPENQPVWYGYWSREGLLQAAFILWRIVLIFSLTRLFTAVTMPLEQGSGIAYFINPFNRITPKAADFALLLTLTLRFIPLILEEAVLIWKVRILKGEWPASWLRRSQEIIQLGVPLVLLSLRRAEELAENLVLRGYGSGNYRTFIMHEKTMQDQLGAVILGVWVSIILVLR